MQDAWPARRGFQPEALQNRLPLDSIHISAKLDKDLMLGNTKKSNEVPWIAVGPGNHAIDTSSAPFPHEPLLILPADRMQFDPIHISLTIVTAWQAKTHFYRLSCISDASASFHATQWTRQRWKGEHRSKWIRRNTAFLSMVALPNLRRVKSYFLFKGTISMDWFEC